jgi:hypothetical protein
MLPADFQMPAALALVASGSVACFAGYRLFRVVLGLFGFILGAFAVSSLFGSGSSSLTLVAAAVGGGLAGAALLLMAYMVGVALVGAALGATIGHLLFAALGREPTWPMVAVASVAGAVGASWLQRYFVIVGTAFGGAWTMLVGGFALVGVKGELASAAREVWVLYPLDPAPGRRWVSLAWIGLGLAGIAVQMGWTGGERGRLAGRRKKNKRQ